MFDPHVPIKGVILNRLAGHRHESIIQKSIEHYCKLPVLGAIPKLENITFPGRHLGLIPPQEHPEAEEAIDKAAEVMSRYLDTKQLRDIARHAPPLKIVCQEYPVLTEEKVTIGVIHDSAFQFYYPENIDALQRAGANVIEFSALTDDLPPSIHALYIGGGFPETHASMLAANEKLKRLSRRLPRTGLPIYAECGGLMYLGEELIWEGKTYPDVRCVASCDWRE